MENHVVNPSVLLPNNLGRIIESSYMQRAFIQLLNILPQSHAVCYYVLRGTMQGLETQLSQMRLCSANGTDWNMLKNEMENIVRFRVY